MKKALITVWVTVTFVVSAEVNPLAELQMRYQQATLLSAKFVQEKHTPFISQPLVSTGYFKHAKKYGLIWVIDTPFFSRTLFTKNQAFVADESGDWSPSDNDQLNQVAAEILTELFSANFTQLSEQFKLSPMTVKDNTWHITLTPTGMWVKKALNRIVIHGEKQIDKIEFFDKNDNHSVLKITHLNLQNEMLSAEQVKQFVP